MLFFLVPLDGIFSENKGMYVLYNYQVFHMLYMIMIRFK
jgi:hypothetical protein